MGVVWDLRPALLEDTFSNSRALFRVSCHSVRVNKVHPKLLKPVWLVFIDRLNLVIAEIANLTKWPQKLCWCDSIYFKHFGLCKFTRKDSNLRLEVLAQPFPHLLLEDRGLHVCLHFSKLNN